MHTTLHFEPNDEPATMAGSFLLNFNAIEWEYVLKTACLIAALLCSSFSAAAFAAEPAGTQTAPAKPTTPASNANSSVDANASIEVDADALDDAGQAQAQDQRDKAWRFNVYLENDSNWLKPNAETDRWYTNGTLISISHQPQFAQDLLPNLPFAKSFADEAHGPVNAAMGYHVGQLMFTPRHIEVKAAQPDDQPFAGYLYAGVFLQRANDVTLDHFQVDIGMVGPSSQAGAIQRAVHRNFPGGLNPRGWDNQIRDEPTLQTFLRKKWRLNVGSIAFSKDENANPLKFQIIPETGIALGTVYRHVEAGATLRMGFVLPDDFGPGYIGNMGSATGNANPQGLSGYGFVGLAGKVVEHNMFLDGSDFHHNTVEVKHQPFTGQASIGATLTYRNDNDTFSITYSQVYMTREFKGQSGSPAMGALRLTWSKAF